MKYKCILLLCMILLIVSVGELTVFGAEEKTASADYLYDAGLLMGSNGDYDLDKEITRLEGVIFVLRYLGLEEIAIGMKDELSIFTDVPSWGVGYTNLAARLRLTSGTSEGEFSPNQMMTRDQFFMLMLRAKGHVEPTTMDQAHQVAFSVGLLDEVLLESSNRSQFFRGDVVNVLSRLVNQDESNGPVELDYWYKVEGVDPLEQAEFQKDMLTIFNNVKTKYKLNYNMVGLYVEELGTGYSWSYGNELVQDTTTGLTKGKFSSASAVKFPMAMAVLTQMEAKGLKLTDSFKDSLSGKTLRFDQVLNPMILQSTNDSFNYLLRYMGRNEVNAYMSSVGVENSVINAELGGGDPYWTLNRLVKEYGTKNASRFTPSDYGILLKHFYKLVQEKNPYMLYLNENMINTIHKSRIPKGINYKYTVAHKTGTYTDMGRFVDVGIVYLPQNPYTLAIILDAQTNHGSCEPFMRELTAAINSYFEKRVSH